ncbi:MAG: cyclopentanol dehydrogenase [Chloroflexi bacterium]|jgi:cyclopentanol dehydrogenase|nr:cyclopentanol dehydrogenase [Chloroflexota bacterium]MDP6497500.1 glucose 1-dehydrogenase [Dehalococcoidia bacterium]MQG54717.1 glucose 1-dehydrogenase [SAR202 cluster bacterium]|tara:strand:+ start:85455 stop:86204 length:750 start_codon:yes stop_codon:yes gene_type:complete
MRLQNKVALISGGAKGMGAVEAKLFAKEGARIVIGDVLETEGKQIESEINEIGGECLFVPLDVTDENQWNEAVAATVRRFSKLDILINNAGIFRTSRVEETSSAEWDHVMDINAKGVFLGAKAAIPAMREAGGGSIINLSSVAGLVGAAYSSAYSASKGAVRLFTKSTAIQYATDGIRCNSIHPGVIQTDMTREAIADSQFKAQRLDPTPLARLGQPEDVAYGALYLASDESSFVTGAELVIDGGWTAQ